MRDLQYHEGYVCRLERLGQSLCNLRNFSAEAMSAGKQGRRAIDAGQSKCSSRRGCWVWMVKEVMVWRRVAGKSTRVCST